MKKILNVGFVVFAIVVLASCAEKFPEIEGNDASNLESTLWVHKSYNNDGTTTLKRASKFDDEAYGIEFRRNGKAIEHRNVGFCGTPPVCYGKFDASWEQTSATTIELDQQIEWMEDMEPVEIEIISLDENRLVIKYNY